MIIAPGSYKKGRIEIRVRGERLALGEHESTRLRMLDEHEFMNLLQQRLGKDEAQIHHLLESYRSSNTQPKEPVC